MQIDTEGFGVGDRSFQEAGGLAGITQLVDQFYDNMDNVERARSIRAMHRPDLAEPKKRLTYFICGWLGGPKLYQEHIGSIDIPQFHAHLSASIEHAEAWLLCMEKAIENQPYSPSFKRYLLAQFRVPAMRIVYNSQ